jgi:hypothetical protein
VTALDRDSGTTGRRRRPPEPGDRRALASGVGWAAVGTGATVAAGLVEIHVTSLPLVRLCAVVALVVVSVLALMLASDDVARAFQRMSGGRADGVVHWLTTAVVSLACVVVLGLAGTPLASQASGGAQIGDDLLVDLAIGLVGGALGGALVAGVAEAAGGLIGFLQRRLAPERAKRWEHRRTARRHWSRRLLMASRWPLVALGGLMLSVLATALTTSGGGAADAHRAPSGSVLGTVVLPLAAWLAGTAAVWVVFSRLTATPHHARRRHGTHAVALGVCVIAVFAYASAGTIEGHARRELSAGTFGSGPPAPVSVAGVPAAQRETFLARRFEPRLWLAGGEKWHPTSVAWYLSQNRAAIVSRPYCAAPGCYGLPCDTVDGPCADTAREQPTAYYSVWTGSHPPAGDRVPEGLGRDWTLIQYWLFYNYDSLQSPVIRQWHQSDWEQISVLLAGDGSMVHPVEVAFSEHCYGARLSAAQVAWDRSGHPMAWVAKGSHANYPRPVDVPIRELRCSLGITPRYLGVAGLFFSPAFDGPSVEVPVGYLAHLTDTTDGARPGPPLRLRPMGTVAAIASFGGRWGLDNNLGAPIVGDNKAGPGPSSPHTQAPARRPFQSMLCSAPWLPPPGARLPCG